MVGVPAMVGPTDWGECLLPPAPVPPALEAEVRRVVGMVPDWLCRVGRSPWVVRTLCDMIGRPMAYAPAPLCDLISLVVSQDNSCRYCYGVQRALLKLAGYHEGYIDRLERDFHTADLSRAERTALDFARRLTRGYPRPGRAEFEELLGAGFSRPAAAEIAAQVASNNFSNRTATLLALPPASIESMVERPLVRLLRPVLAWRMRSHRPPPPPPALPNEGRPFARLVAALGDSPVAGMLRRTIDAAWASDALPARTKGLMLAVVARALGCTYSESEARRLLEREDLAPVEIDEILANLGSSRLDGREAQLVPFARETVHYQTATLQRRMREVAQGLDPEALLEVIGVVALANALCRLSVVLDAS